MEVTFQAPVLGVSRTAIVLALLALGVGGLVAGCQAKARTPPGVFVHRTRVDIDYWLAVSADIGDRDEITLQELSAACQSFADAVADVTRSDDLVILDNSTLHRSAELLAGKYLGEPAALEMEDWLTRDEGAVEDALNEIGNEYGPSGREVAAAYAADRLTPPSKEAETDFVVYLAARSNDEAVVVRRSVEPLTSVTNTAGRSGIELMRADGSTIAVDPAWCDA